MSDTTTTTATTTIKIDLSGDFNCAPADHERSNWNHLIILDPEARTIEVRTEFGNGTPMRVWQGVDIKIGSIPDGTADADDLREYLESDEATDLLAAIIDGHDVRWNGSNQVGHLTDDAQTALDDLSREIAGVELPGYWDAAEYLSADWHTVMAGCDGTGEWFDDHADHEVESALPSVRLDRAKVREYLAATWADSVLPKLLAEGVHVSNGREVGNGFDAEARVDDCDDLQVRVRDVASGEWSDWTDVKGREAKSLDDLRQVAIDAAGCPGDYVTFDVEAE